MEQMAFIQPPLIMVKKLPPITAPTAEEKRKEEVIQHLHKVIDGAEKPSMKDYIIPDIKTEMVGPKEAIEFYKLSKGNRPIRLAHVMWLAKQILDGKWLVGPPFMLDTRNVFIVGHHRAEAISRAGKYVPVVIMRGVDPRIREYSNQHKAETLGNELKVAGFANCNAEAAALRLAVVLTSEKRIPIQTVGDFKDWRKVFVGLDDIVSCFAGKDPWRKSSIVGAVVYAYNTDPNIVMRCAHQITSGASLAEGHPILVFRNWYTKHIEKFISGGGDERIKTFTWRILHTLRSVIEGTKCRDLKKEVSSEVLNKDLEFFRAANLTRKAESLLSYWRAPRVSSDDFMRYALGEID